MSLFNQPLDKATNLLPQDGTVNYYGPILPAEEAHHYFRRLFDDIVWKQDEAIIFGRHIITKRKVAWYGDRPYAYTYSQTTKQARPWTPELLALKKLVEQASGDHFNSCLLNLYHRGEEGMGWHSDDEKTLAPNSSIASLSLGAARKFSFRHRASKESLSLILEPGSLLLMKGTTQTYWQHQLPKTKKVNDPRINLTFRSMVEPATG